MPGAVTLLDLQTGKALVEFREPKGPVNCLALSPDGKQLVAGCGDAAAYVWCLDEKKLLATLKDHSLPVLSAAFNIDGKYLVTGGTDAMVQTWDTGNLAAGSPPTMVGGEVRSSRSAGRRSKEGEAKHTFGVLIGGREDRSLRVMSTARPRVAAQRRVPRAG